MAEKKSTSKRPARAGQAPKSTPSGATVDPAPAKTAPTKPAPAKAAPAKVAPAKVAPAKVAPAKVAPAKVAPAKAAAATVAPAKVVPAKESLAEAKKVSIKVASPKLPAAALPKPPAPAAKPVSETVLEGAAATPVRSAEPAPSAPPARRGRSSQPIVIPPILFEGDESPAPAAGGPGQRYALSAAQLIEAASTGGELPEAYGTQRLWVTARDPHWLYAHWDFSREQLRAANALARDGRLALRVLAADGRRECEMQMHPESRHWFLHVMQAGSTYSVELGYTDHEGDWQSLDVAAPVTTPPDTLASDDRVQFESVPIYVPFADLIAAVKSVVDQHTPLIELLPLLREQRWPRLPTATAAPAPVTWTPAREAALAKLVNVDAVRRVWIGSLEITELVRRQLERDWSSQAAAGAEAGRGLGGLGSLSSPIGGAAEARKGFWFNVNAELIVYGATEPGAAVTLGGRPIALRADGSFSFRFALPDGQFELPAVATSADGEDRRVAGLHFSRSTAYRGDVGKHAQNAALRPPRPEHLGEAQDA